MLTRIQSEIAKLLAARRNQQSYFAGGAALNRDYGRVSLDLDIFHDDRDFCEESFKSDVRCLVETGFGVAETRSEPGFFEARVSCGKEFTEVQWLVDSPFRFFPLVEDGVFGLRLGDHDLAINKILAMCGREAARDYYDVCAIIARGAPMEAYLWAAPGKDPGISLDLLLDNLAWASSYWRPEDMEAVSGPKMDFMDCKRLLLSTLKNARIAFREAPIGKAGLMFLNPDTLQPFWPDFSKEYLAHPGTFHGSMPRFPKCGEPERKTRWFRRF